MASAVKGAAAAATAPEVPTWELVCFCLYNDYEKKELLGNPRLPMRTIDELFLCRAILGKLFMTSEDCTDLKRRLRSGGFSDDLTNLKILPDSETNVQEAYERAKRSLKPSYNNDDKDINHRWYKNNSFSIEILMRMTQNSINQRLKSKGQSTPVNQYNVNSTKDSDKATVPTDIADELEPPQKKMKPDDGTRSHQGYFSQDSFYSSSGLFSYLRKDPPTGIPHWYPNDWYHNEPARAGSCFAMQDVAAEALKSVPISPMREEWESFPPLHIDLTSEDAATPVTIDITQSYDEDDDDHEDCKVRVAEEQNPPVVPNPSSQSEVSEDEKPLSSELVNIWTAFVTRSQPYQPSIDRELTSLAMNDLSLSASQDKGEESPMTGPTLVEDTTLVHFMQDDDPPKWNLSSFMITLAAWSMGFHVLLGTLLGLDHAGFWGERTNPLRICFSVETMSRPKVSPFGTVDSATFSDANQGSWLEREDSLSGMMGMMTNHTMYLHRQCSPWYGAVIIALGVLATIWILSRQLQKRKV